jgi:hypothetical protein
LFALVLFQSDTHTLDSRVCQILEEKSKKEWGKEKESENQMKFLFKKNLFSNNS